MTVSRGTTNRNDRGSSYSRRRRRAWLVETYRADQDSGIDGYALPFGLGVAACRCYRCGCLLTVYTVTVDRIKPGCMGGTYRRDNIRPACGKCNSETGGALRRTPTKTSGPGATATAHTSNTDESISSPGSESLQAVV